MTLTESEASRLFAFASEIRQKRAYLLILFLSLAQIGSGVLMGFIPTLSTNYFASILDDSVDLSCVNQPEGQEPGTTCKEAHTLAVFWDAGKLFMARLFLAILFNSYVQRYSTIYGRKPFIILAMSSALLPSVLLLLHLKIDIPFYWFYVGKTWELSFCLPSLCYSYITDRIDEASADMVYVVYLFSAALSSCFGAFFVASSILEDAVCAVVISLTLTGVSVLLLLAFLPESVSSTTQLNGLLMADDTHVDMTRTTYNHWIRPFQDMYISFKLPHSNQHLAYLILVYVIFEFINQRDSEMELQYLQEVAGFGTVEQSTYLMIRFLMAAFIYAILFPLWSICFARTYKDAFGLGFGLAAVKLFGMIFVRSRQLAFLLETCGAMDALVTLMIYRVLEHHNSSHPSQSLTTTVSGIRSIAQGLSPVFHASLFALFRHVGFYFPGAPFVSLFCMAVGGFFVLLNIRVEYYGFLTPVSTFVRMVTLTFFSDDEDLESCVNLPVSGRGYFSEEDTNNTSSTATSEDEEVSTFTPVTRFDEKHLI